MSIVATFLLLNILSLGGDPNANLVEYEGGRAHVQSLRAFIEETSATQSERVSSRAELRIFVSLQNSEAYRDTNHPGDSTTEGESDGFRVCGEETSIRGKSPCLETAPRLAGEGVYAEGLSALEAIFSLDIAGYTLSIFLEG